VNIRDAMYEWMKARGIRYMFGNPGSTELPLLIDFPETARYALALQESIALAMADGYAQVSGTPGLVNLHVAPGLGNAMGVLFTAMKNRSPLIVTCGQQDTRHLILDPLLSGNLVGMARPVTKWAYEVVQPQDVIAVMEQAYLTAMTPPRGPVFISVPMNFWDAPGEVPPLRRLNPPGVPQGLETLAQTLASAQNPALVIGASVDAANAWEETIQLAEKRRCTVYSAPLNSRAGFPTHHPLFRGMLLPAAPRLQQMLAAHDVILVVGAPVFLLYPYFPGAITPPTAQTFLMTDDPSDAARAPVAASFVGDIKSTLAALVGQIPQNEIPMPSRAAEEAKRRSEAARTKSRMGVPFVLQTLARHLPPDTILFDESVSSSLILRETLPVRQPRSYFTSGSGGLGWAMPAAVGAKLAQPDRPVVCVIGDGSVMYSVQALWSAANEKANVKYLVLNNSGYSILKSFTKAFYPGMEGTVPGLDVPVLDLVSVAQGLGIHAERVEHPDQLDAALQRTMEAGSPVLLDVQIDKTVPNLF
jgi:benzoylformate decarboxylase